MQTISKAILILLLSTLILSCNNSKKENSNKEKQTFSLTGTIINTDTDTLVLYMPNEDPYNRNIKIPVEDGKFRYDFEVDHPIGYDLMFWKNGSPGGRWMTVFLEKSDLEITIYPEDQWEENTIKGGEVTSEWNGFLKKQENVLGVDMEALYAELQILQSNGKYYTPEMQQLLHKRNAAGGNEVEIINKKIGRLREQNKTLSDSAKFVIEQIDKYYDGKNKWEEEYINNHDNIIAYYLFFTKLSFRPEKLELKQAQNNLELFIQRFPDHPYNAISKTKLNSLDEIQVGKNFVDFTLPNLAGETITLSNLIKGKKAVINLWATWCRPCIIKNRELVPVYHEFKDQNFTVVGVAGEYKNTDALVRFLVKENYPWLNLVELDHKNLIWEKYGISRAGGGLFLVDENGKIVAIEPSVEEIKQFLENAG